MLVPVRSGDRKSTRLNSSHGYISYAVFCLKKKKATFRYTVPLTKIFLTRLFSKLRLKRKDFQEILRLPWAQYFFFNDTATTEISTLSLHDALPIRPVRSQVSRTGRARRFRRLLSTRALRRQDRKSTRLNSSHGYISYAVFCLKKKKKQTSPTLIKKKKKKKKQTK